MKEKFQQLRHRIQVCEAPHRSSLRAGIGVRAQTSDSLCVRVDQVPHMPHGDSSKHCYVRVTGLSTIGAYALVPCLSPSPTCPGCSPCCHFRSHRLAVSAITASILCSSHPTFPWCTCCLRTQSRKGPVSSRAVHCREGY